MKASVIITLIVCGTVLLIVPYIYNTIAVGQVALARTVLDKKMVTANLPTYGDPICMLAGLGMIVVAVVAGLTRKEHKATAS